MNVIARAFIFLAFVSTAAVVAGCQGQSSSPVKEASKLYDVTGSVAAVDRDKKTVTLDHEDIPGLMKAMKMEFSVEDLKVLDGVLVGDAVTGKLKADGGNYVVTSLSKR